MIGGQGINPARQGKQIFLAETGLALRVSGRVFVRLGQRNVGLMSAGVAFFSILAIFPGLAAVIALFGFLADPGVIREQMTLLREFAPDEAFRLLNTQVEALLSANQSTLGWATLISTAAALWAARAGVAALQRGLNAIHGADNRTTFWQALSALGLTVALVAVVLVALLVVIVVPVALALIPLGPMAGPALVVVPWIAALGVLVLGLWLIYRYGPNHGPDRLPRRVMPGVILAVVVWAAASVGFSYYLKNFGSYNQVYGSIGAVIALLMWFYIGAYVVLLGACLNAEMDLRAARDA